MKILLLSVFWLAGLMLFAERTPVTIANYDLAERFSAANVDRMVHSTTVTPNWLKYSNRFWYEYRTPEGRRFHIVDANTGRRTDLFDLDRLAAQITAIVRDPFEGRNLPIQNLRFIDDETRVRFSIQSTLPEQPRPNVGESQDSDQRRVTGGGSGARQRFWFSYDLRTNELVHLEDFEPETRYPSWANISPDGQTILFMRHFDLHWMDRENFEKFRADANDSTIVEHRITFDGEEHFAWGSRPRGQTNVDVRRTINDRFSTNAVWSPDSRHFAIIRTDLREVEDLWVINSIAHPRPTLETYRYHMAGEANGSHQHLYLFDTQTMTPRGVDTWAFRHQTMSIFREPTLQSDRNNDWNPAVWLGFNDKFYMQRTSRDLKRIDICVVDIATATARPLIEERMNTSQEIRPLRLVEGTGELIHWSQRSGWGHFYLYDSEGNLINPITSGPFHVESIQGINPRTRTLFVNAMGREPGRHPNYQKLYSVNLNGRNMTLLTPGDYFHTVSVNDAGTHFVSNFSRVNTVPKSELRDTQGRVVSHLETADLSLLFEAGYQFPTPFTVKAADGITDLFGVMYKPFDFCETKSYALVMYVYPGPQTEVVNYSFSARLDRTDRLAQLGMIVITVGNLGGHHVRSKWYHNYGYGNLRDYGLRCKVTAGQQLAARYPFIDINRVGIWGISGGGFMSAAAILTFPDFFRVAIADVGNHDNNIYNRWWVEKHHGLIEEVISRTGDDGVARNDTIFRLNNPMGTNQQLAANLQGRLLLTHGEIDNNVHPANTMRLAHALVRARKRFDMFIFPTQRHSLDAFHREYFFWMKADYFSRHLMGDQTIRPIDIPQMRRW